MTTVLESDIKLAKMFSFLGHTYHENEKGAPRRHTSDKMLMQQGTAQLTIVLEVHRNEGVIQAGTAIVIGIFNLAPMPKARVQSQSESGEDGRVP